MKGPLFPASSTGAVDQLNPIRIRIFNETDPRTTLPNPDGSRSGSIPCSFSCASVSIQVIDRERDMPVTRTEVVAATVVKG